jgi:hypothetical protein
MQVWKEFQEKNKDRFLSVLNTISERIKWEDSCYGVVYNDDDVKIAWFDVEFEND